MPAKKLRTQKPLPGRRRRTAAYTALDPDTEKLVRDTMRYFHVSRSFVLAVAAAESMGVTPKERYSDPTDGKVRLVKGNRVSA